MGQSVGQIFLPVGLTVFGDHDGASRANRLKLAIVEFARAY